MEQDIRKGQFRICFCNISNKWFYSEVAFNKIIQCEDKGYLISGYTNSYGAGSYDCLFIKTDFLGNLISSKTFGGSAEEGLRSGTIPAKGIVKLYCKLEKRSKFSVKVYDAIRFLFFAIEINNEIEIKKVVYFR